MFHFHPLWLLVHSDPILLNSFIFILKLMAKVEKPNYVYLLLVVPLTFSFTAFFISSKHHVQKDEVSIDIDMNAEQVSNLIADAGTNWGYLIKILPELQPSKCPLESFSPQGSLEKSILTVRVPKWCCSEQI